MVCPSRSGCWRSPLDAWPGPASRSERYGDWDLNPFTEEKVESIRSRSADRPQPTRSDISSDSSPLMSSTSSPTRPIAPASSRSTNPLATARAGGFVVVEDRLGVQQRDAFAAQPYVPDVLDVGGVQRDDAGA